MKRTAGVEQAAGVEPLERRALRALLASSLLDEHLRAVHAHLSQVTELVGQPLLHQGEGAVSSAEDEPRKPSPLFL